MSKLEKLIKKFCPNGVKYTALGTVMDYEQPTKYIVKSTKYDDNFAIPVLTAGQTFILGYTNEDTGIYKASSQEPVIIFDDFTTSFHWVDFDFKVKSSAIKMLTAKDESISDQRFLYYAMQCIQYVPCDHTRQWINRYSKFHIPLPPMPVQREIVRILDIFTKLTVELTAKLTAELTARKKQYEYYRTEILTFYNKAEVNWLSIGEIFKVKNGYTPAKRISKFWTDGTIPWFRMEDIRTNGRILTDAIQHVTPQAVKGGKLFSKNSLIISTTATIGEHALIKVDALTNQQMTCLTIKPQYENNLNVKFAFYYCFILGEWCRKNVNNGGSLPIINAKKLKKFLFPIPSLEEQKRIVSILDRFDALYNDITSGLTAEIEARQKQYEYYRDKLLTFKELSE